MKIEDYCNFCANRKGKCDFKEHDVAHHEFSPFHVMPDVQYAICARCDKMQYVDYSKFVGENAIACHTCRLKGENIERFEDYAAADTVESPQEESVKDLENFHINSPKPPFEGSLEYDTDKPEYISTGPDRFIDLVRIICANHKVEPLVDDYKVALRLCEETK